MTQRILVTPRSAPGHPALDRLEAAGYALVIPTPGEVPSAEQLRAALPGCVGYLAGVERIDAETLRGAPELRAIARNGTGVEAIDVAAAEQQGIRVLRAPAANAQGVAELAIALMLAAARHLPTVVEGVRAGGWPRQRGIELAGRTLGIVGCGQIGRRVARIALAIGMEVRAFDAFPDASFDPGPGFHYDSLAAVLDVADVLTLHAPPAERPLLDAVALGALRPGAIVVNTARSSLVDEDAVLAALDGGALGAYATDVFDPEPPGRTPLTQHPRCIGTAHIGGFTTESVDRAMTAAADALIDALSSAR